MRHKPLLFGSLSGCGCCCWIQNKTSLRTERDAPIRTSGIPQAQICSSAKVGAGGRECLNELNMQTWRGKKPVAQIIRQARMEFLDNIFKAVDAKVE
jgi:hypothetical protein